MSGAVQVTVPAIGHADIAATTTTLEYISGKTQTDVSEGAFT